MRPKCIQLKSLLMNNCTSPLQKPSLIGFIRCSNAQKHLVCFWTIHVSMKHPGRWKHLFNGVRQNIKLHWRQFCAGGLMGSESGRCRWNPFLRSQTISFVNVMPSLHSGFPLEIMSSNLSNGIENFTKRNCNSNDEVITQASQTLEGAFAGFNHILSIQFPWEGRKLCSDLCTSGFLHHFQRMGSWKAGSNEVVITF